MCEDRKREAGDIFAPVKSDVFLPAQSAWEAVMMAIL